MTKVILSHYCEYKKLNIDEILNINNWESFDNTNYCYCCVLPDSSSYFLEISKLADRDTGDIYFVGIPIYPNKKLIYSKFELTEDQFEFLKLKLL